MPRRKPAQPKCLAEKLKQVRENLGYTQQRMFEELEKEMGDESTLHFGYITRYESGKRVPTLLVLLAYSRIANVDGSFC